MGKYQNLSTQTVLDEFERGKVFGYIVANPGAHYSCIKETLKLTSGTVTHHLDVLEKFDFIDSYMDGHYRRYVSKGTQPFHLKTKHEKMMESIVGVVESNPGVSQKSLAEKIGIPVRVAFSCLKDAVESGILTSERDGQRVRYFPAGR